MLNIKEKRIFDILRNGKRTEITLKDNHITKVVVEKKMKFLLFLEMAIGFIMIMKTIFL